MTLTTRRTTLRVPWGDSIRFTVSPIYEGDGTTVAADLGTATFALYLGLTADGAAALSLTSAGYFTVVDASAGTVNVTVPFSAYSDDLAEGTTYFAELWMTRAGNTERITPALRLTFEKSIRS